MKGKCFSKAVLGPLLLLCTSAPAMAAEAVVCHSAIQTQTTISGLGYQSYPQLSNTTRFTCATSGVSYTIPQLAQLGWTIAQLVPVVYSTEYHANGTATLRQRQQLILQK